MAPVLCSRWMPIGRAANGWFFRSTPPDCKVDGCLSPGRTVFLFVWLAVSVLAGNPGAPHRGRSRRLRRALPHRRPNPRLSAPSNTSKLPPVAWCCRRPRCAHRVHPGARRHRPAGLANIAARRVRLASRPESQGPLHSGQWPAHRPLGRDLIGPPAGGATVSDTAAIRSRRENRARPAGRFLDRHRTSSAGSCRRRGRRAGGRLDRLRGAGLRPFHPQRPAVGDPLALAETVPGPLTDAFAARPVSMASSSC